MLEHQVEIEADRKDYPGKAPASWLILAAGVVLLIAAASQRHDFIGNPGIEAFAPMAAGVIATILINLGGPSSLRLTPAIVRVFSYPAILALLVICVAVAVHSGAGYEGGGRALDFECYQNARLTAGAGLDPYNEEDCATIWPGVSSERLPYLYSPAFLLVMEPLDVLPEKLDLAIWRVMLASSVFLSLLLLLGMNASCTRPILVALALPLLLFDGPVLQAVRWGNATPFAVLLIVLMMVLDGRIWIQGILGASLALLKATFVLPLLLIRNLRTLTCLIATLLLGIAVTSALYPPSIWVSFSESLVRLSEETGYSGRGNISLLSTGYRIANYTVGQELRSAVAESASAKMELNSYTGFLAKAIFSIIILLFAGLLLLIWRRKPFRFDRRETLSMVSVLITISAPLSWDHYGILLLPFLATFISNENFTGRFAASLPMMIWVLAPMPLRDTSAIGLFDILSGAIRPVTSMLSIATVMILGGEKNAANRD